MNFKYVLKNNILIYSLYSYFRDFYSFIKKRIAMFFYAKNGDKVLNNIENLLYRKYNFYFACGTLLGIVRDDALIKRDLDIDINLKIKNENEIFALREYLNNNGYKLKYEFIVNGVGIVQDAFVYLNVKIDIAYTYESDNKYEYYYVLYSDCKVLKLHYYKVDNVVRRDFHNFKVSVPKECEKVLECNYGKKWRSPDNSYKYWENPCYHKTNFSGKIIGH